MSAAVAGPQGPLRPGAADTAVAQFAAEASLALAGTLNLRRTLGRIVTLGVPRLGTWCAVIVPEAQLHRVVVAGVGVRTPLVRTVSVVPALATPGRHAVDPDALAEFGCSPEHVGPDTHEALTVAMTAQGATMGVLVVVRRRDLDETDAMVRELAERAALAVAAARIYEERSALASTLRAALLPPELPELPGIELGARYRAAAEATQIGGDFYQVYPCGDEEWAFEIGDVCGKGVNAAILTGQARQSLRTAALVEQDPARTLALLNDAMLAVDGTQFVSVVHGRLRRAGDAVTVDLAAGGHPYPLLLRADGSVDTVPAPGMIIGMLREARFSSVGVQLAPGDALVLYTDGVTEARVGGEQLGITRLTALLRDCAGMSAQAITERLEQLVLDYLDGRPHDDIALLAIRAQPSTDGVSE